MQGCRATEVLPDLTGRFTFVDCKVRPPSSFGLTTYNLIINANPDDIDSYFVFVNNVTLAGSFAIEDATQDFQFTDSQSFLLNNYTITNTNTKVTIAKRDGPTWNLILIDRELSALLQDAELDMSTPQPSDTQGCLLQGIVSSTPDGEQICETNFRVTISCLQSVRVLNYVFYNTDILPILRGKGCTVAARARWLNIDPADIMTYSMLRLMLSLLLFGRFDVQLLGQRYYQKFLDKLSKSCFANFDFIFTGNQYYPCFAAYFRQ